VTIDLAIAAGSPVVVRYARVMAEEDGVPMTTAYVRRILAAYRRAVRAGTID
jgi:hypothetical protein